MCDPAAELALTRVNLIRVQVLEVTGHTAEGQHMRLGDGATPRRDEDVTSIEVLPEQRGELAAVDGRARRLRR